MTVVEIEINVSAIFMMIGMLYAVSTLDGQVIMEVGRSQLECGSWLGIPHLYALLIIESEGGGGLILPVDMSRSFASSENR